MTEKDTPRIIAFTGGGTGGHIDPLLRVKETLDELTREKSLSCETWYFGPADHFKERIAAAGMRHVPVLGAKFRRYFSLANLIDIPKFCIALLQAIVRMFFVMPDVLFSKGGPGALPVVIAAWIYRIPIIVHESDVRMGLTNTLSSLFAKRVLVSFERTEKTLGSPKVRYVGNPVRIAPRDIVFRPQEAKASMRVHSERPLLFIVGGSQGSTRINEFIIVNIKEILEHADVIHQTGEGHFKKTFELARAAYPQAEEFRFASAARESVGEEETSQAPMRAKPVAYQLTPYLLNEYEKVLQAADLVVARAGSGTLSGIAEYGKPSILIPLKESANDHQRLNAYEFARGGAAIVIEEPNLIHTLFLRHINELLRDPARLAQMGKAAYERRTPDAAKEIVKEIIGLMPSPRA